jgi:hypothetical protein
MATVVTEALFSLPFGTFHNAWAKIGHGLIDADDGPGGR